jgi:glycosyltransferase involved in cell wall biosynthesis
MGELMGQARATDRTRAWTAAEKAAVGVSIVMPCLNEAQCLPRCIPNALEALRRIETDYGLSGEIVIADNGSTDGSQMLATGLGARVVDVQERGYGAALIGGSKAARGKYIIMGDADGSYDFLDGVAMIGELERGAELCMGSRFKGGISPGAMPWKNRYIGNPALTGVLNLFFRPGISDAHSGLRAIRKDSFLDLGLSGSGMEFASEMVIKAALRKLRIAETPVKLLPDLRDRAPHLRPWRDGWRHLRYLFMLSPTWVFGVPALVGAFAALVVLTLVALNSMKLVSVPFLGNYWTILAAALLSVSHMAAIMAVAGRIFGVKQGYRKPSGRWNAVRRWLSLETMLLSGLLLIAGGIATLCAVALAWQSRGFTGEQSVVAPVFGTLLTTLGMQNFLGGFLLAIVGGNEASLMRNEVAEQAQAKPLRKAA